MLVRSAIDARWKLVFATLWLSLHLFAFGALADINHLELGAANYGAVGVYSAKRFLVLERTYQDLIATYGPRGRIYLNDVDEYGLQMAMDFSKYWLQKHGYNEIEVIALPGDYSRLDFPAVTSAHLTNPSWQQLPNSGFERRENRGIVKTLERIARQSSTGLAITTYYYGQHDAMTFLEERLKNSSLERTGKNGYYYFLPNGSDPKSVYTRKQMPEYQPKVFILKARARLCRDAHLRL